MGSVFNIGVSALLSFQRGLSTTSHNISNANTEGYSRQRIELGTRPAQEFGFGFVGNGVNLTNIARLHDDYLVSQLQIAGSENQRLTTFADLTGQVNNLLADENGGIAPVMQRFFASLQDVSNDPSSVPARQVLLSDAQGLVNRFKFMQAQFDQVNQSLNQRLSTQVDQVNSLSANIAKLNLAIISATRGGTGAAPNDMLDQRDELINKLSQLVSVTTVDDSNGAKNVFFGKGQVLVFGGDVNRLTTTRNAEDFSQLNIAYVTPGGSQDITAQVSGGEIGGVLDFRRSVLSQTGNDLGRIAMVLSDTFNAQHQQGLDLNGLLGGDFFNTPAPTVINNLNNTGTAAVTATVTNVTALTTSDYRLTYNGVNYTLLRLSDNTSVTGAGPLAMDGLSVAIGAGAAAGDSFLVRPTYSAAGALSLAIGNVNDIAVAGPVRVAAEVANIGDAQISFGQVLDITDPDLFDTVQIVFNNPPTSFDVLNITDATTIAAGVAYTPGANIDFNGLRVSVSGTPQAGDTFRVERNNGGSNDNRNALLLSGLRDQLLVGGSSTIEQSYSTAVARVGTLGSQAQINLNAQTSLLNQLQLQRDAVSGVNLDEEAVDLVRYQQAYEAAAQVISVANTLFDTLLGAVRR